MDKFLKRDAGIYIHIPFCVKKCAYCDFYSGAAGEKAEEKRGTYFDALVSEIREAGDGVTPRVGSVFIGGGTPTSVPPKYLARVMEAVRASFDLSPDAEISMESNPGTITEEKLRAYRAMGVNRLSIGLQSTENDLLKTLGRIHTYEEFLSGYDAARRAGFDNINIDLMSGIPGLTVEQWRNTLEKTVALSPEHLSCYSLIIEENTPFYALYGSEKGRALLPSEEEDREMYHLTGALLENAGYRRYEISNYARPGRECRHNTGYWTGMAYYGFGAAAASCLPGSGEILMRRKKNAQALNYRTEPPIETEELTEKDLMSEFMILGLRMTDGISEAEFEQRFGRPLSEAFGDAVEKHVSYGTLVRAEGRVRLTEYGLDVANIVMEEFL